MTSAAPNQRGDPWSREEVEATVADYFSMLTLELAAQTYSKTEHRRNLALKLNGRSDSAIERKHQNITAILLELDHPPIIGYKPLTNYQRLLFDVVADRLGRTPTLEAAATAAIEQPASPPTYQDFGSIEVARPQLAATPSKIESPLPNTVSPLELRAVKRDFIQREARNRSLGQAGELLVLELERWRLLRAGREKLAGNVLHVSRELGDGPGFDILSFRADGTERFIEVKTTAFGRETPFFVTQRELEVSERAHDKYSIYRLFNFRRQPRLFEMPGRIGDHCHLQPQTFRATFS